jgi:ferredoxin
MEAYKRLQKVLDLHPMGAPEMDEFFEILMELFTPEEAALACTLSFNLAMPEEIAQNARMPLKRANYLLEAMANKGAIICVKKGGIARYALIPPMPGFFEFSLIKGDRNPRTEKMGRLWDHYYTNCLGPELHRSGISLCRVIPVDKYIPKDIEVMDFEHSSMVIEKARTLALGKCQCRFSSRKCNAPLDVCIIMDFWADFLIDRCLVRKIEKDEAMDAMKRAEEAGLVHVLNNAHNSPFICNCCPCCCFMLRGLTQFNYNRTLATSRFIATIDASKCKGCGLCEKRCHFGALQIVYNKIVLNEERCYGCGLCISECHEGSISLKERKDYKGPFINGQSLLQSIGEAKGKWESFIKKR